MTPTPFSASWPSGIRQRACSHRSFSACRRILTGYRLARVIVQRPRFVKKFCRFAFCLGRNPTVKSFQYPLNPRNICSPLHGPAVAGTRPAGPHHHPVTLHSYNRLEQWKFPLPPGLCSGCLLKSGFWTPNAFAGRAIFAHSIRFSPSSTFHPPKTKSCHPEGLPFAPEGSQLPRHTKFRRTRPPTLPANASRLHHSRIA